MGYSTGIYCLDLNGKLIWTFDLGFPRYQLNGVAIDDSGNVYASSRSGHVFKLSKDGKLIWEKKLSNKLEPWGNPSISLKHNLVFFTYSNKEKYGFIHCLNTDGEKVWKKRTNAMRGTCTFSNSHNYLYYPDLNGYINKLDILSGETIRKVRINKTIRSLWTSVTVDREDNLLFSVKDSNTNGRIIKMNNDLDMIWQFNCGKALSIPIIKANGDILFGSWDGHYYSIKTKDKK